jgi:hypothetical protein
MCGSGGRDKPEGVLGVEGSEFGDASLGDEEVDEVERREEAIVRRMWDSVLMVAEVTQATLTQSVFELAQ